MIFKSNEIERATIFITNLFSKGKSVKIEPIQRVATLSQNNYIWLVFTHVGYETGNTKDDMYQHCLKLFTLYKNIEINGSISSIPLTLSGMDLKQKSWFIDQCVIYFRSEGFDVPDPEDIKFRLMYEHYRNLGLI